MYPANKNRIKHIQKDVAKILKTFQKNPQKGEEFFDDPRWNYMETCRLENIILETLLREKYPRFQQYYEYLKYPQYRLRELYENIDEDYNHFGLGLGNLGGLDSSYNGFHSLNPGL